MANGRCRRCDRPAEAGPCCSPCAADVMAKAFTPSTAAGGGNCPVSTVNFHRVRRRRPPSPPCNLPCSAPEPSSLLLAQEASACNFPRLSYGYPPPHLAPSPRRGRDHPLHGAGRRGVLHQAQGHHADGYIGTPARSCSAWMVSSASPSHQTKHLQNINPGIPPLEESPVEESPAMAGELHGHFHKKHMGDARRAEAITATFEPVEYLLNRPEVQSIPQVR